MTNTILIFIKCFDNANFDALVKALPNLAAKSFRAAQGGRIICAGLLS